MKGKARQRAREAEVKRFSPLFDSAFLFLFGRKESKPITLALLNAVLSGAGLPLVESVDEIGQITADAALPGGIECRTARCDVVVVANDAVYDIESQGLHADIANKSLFYGSKLIWEHTPKGSEANGYFNIPQTVVITLLHDQVLFPHSSQFITVGSLQWEIGAHSEVATDRMMFVVVEMEKIAKRYNRLDGEILSDESLAWLYLLAKGYSNAGEVEIMADTFLTMEDFATRYGLAIGDKKLQRAYDKYIEGIMEYNTMRYEAHKSGYDEGYEEGKAAGEAAGRTKGEAEGRAEGRAEGSAEAIAAASDAARATMAELGIGDESIRRILGSIEAAAVPRRE